VSRFDYEMVAKLAAQRAGLNVDATKGYLIDSRLGPVARREGFDSVANLLAAVRDREEPRLIWAVVEAMGQADPTFFREPEIFNQLADDVLPRLARLAPGGAVRVWSAGCGTGQDIYSLAMLLEEGRGGPTPVDLFATDLSERALEKAKVGLYSQFEVQRGLSAHRLVRHFERQGEAFVLSARVRERVRWSRVNLVEDPKEIGRFELVLCRGVLNALTRPARARLMQNLASALEPGGVLVLGGQDQAAEIDRSLRPMPGRPGFYTAISPVEATG
jgi:chemotaxis protein methyltransferase CheR